MQIVILGLGMPVISLLLRKLYRKGEAMTAGQAVERYIVSMLITALATAAAMTVLCEDGSSLMEKADRLPSFDLKYVLLEAGNVLLTALGEWAYTTRRLKATVDLEGYRNSAEKSCFRRDCFCWHCWR